MFFKTAVAPQEWQGTESGLQLYHDLQAQIPSALQVSFIQHMYSAMHLYHGKMVGVPFAHTI